MDIDGIYHLGEDSRHVLGDFSKLNVWTAWRNEERTTNELEFARPLRARRLG